MKVKEFNKSLKENGAKRMIYLYITSEINLTSKQLDKVIKIKNEENKKFRTNS